MERVLSLENEMDLARKHRAYLESQQSEFSIVQIC